MSYRKNRKLEDSFSQRCLTRRGIIDKEKALTGAHNEAETKLGHLLLKQSTDPLTSAVAREMTRIDQDGTRVKADVERTKKQFMQRLTLLPEPTVILRRRRTRTTPTLPTRRNSTGSLSAIDAFMVRGKRKRNLWEGQKSLDPPQLFSLHVPCQPLTGAEETEIYQRNAVLLCKSKQGKMKPLQRFRHSVPLPVMTSDDNNKMAAHGKLIRQPIDAHENLKLLTIQGRKSTTATPPATAMSTSIITHHQQSLSQPQGRNDDYDETDFTGQPYSQLTKPKASTTKVPSLSLGSAKTTLSARINTTTARASAASSSTPRKEGILLTELHSRRSDEQPPKPSARKVQFNAADSAADVAAADDEEDEDVVDRRVHSIRQRTGTAAARSSASSSHLLPINRHQVFVVVRMDSPDKRNRPPQPIFGNVTSVASATATDRMDRRAAASVPMTDALMVKGKF